MCKYIDPEIGETILEQLGGRKRLQLFTGAWGFLHQPEGASFRFQMNEEMNMVQITLNGMDLYDLTFYWVKDGERMKVREVKDIYNDQLMDIFEEVTGLYLTMNARK